MEILHQQETHGVDFDDTVFLREHFTRLFGRLKGRLSPVTLHSQPVIADIPNVDHTPRDIRGVGSLSLFFHSKRIAIPGVPERLRAEAASGHRLVGISGRPATVEWDLMTRRQIEAYRLPIEDVILTPLGVSTKVSKAHAIKENDVREFSDDDWPTVCYLASMFRDLKVNFIQHPINNASNMNAYLDRFPNIRVIPLSQWGRF